MILFLNRYFLKKDKHVHFFLFFFKNDLNLRITNKHNTGDDTRIWRPPQSEAGESAYFIACNRNKKSVTVDLKSKQGLEIIYKLAKISDVVVENFPPQKADSLGIGYQKLSSLNPRLVYASITG